MFEERLEEVEKSATRSDIDELLTTVAAHGSRLGWSRSYPIVAPASGGAENK